MRSGTLNTWNHIYRWSLNKLWLFLYSRPKQEKSAAFKVMKLCLFFTHSKRLQRSRTIAVPKASGNSCAPPVLEVTMETPTYLEVPDFQRVAILGDYASGVTIANNTQQSLKIGHWCRDAKISECISFFSCNVSRPASWFKFLSSRPEVWLGGQWLWISLTSGVSGSLASCRHRAMIGGHLRAGRVSGFSGCDLWPLQWKKTNKPRFKGFNLAT